MGLRIEKYFENEWEFEYDEIANEYTHDNLWRAIDLLDHDDFQAEIIFKVLIKEYPFFIDAYNHLSIAFSNQNKRFESLLTAEKAYTIGKEVLPKSFNIKKDKLIWANLKNRPFLRSCQIYGLELQDANNHSKAIEIFDEILLLNEDDNQGIRYLKLESLFALKDFLGVKKILAKYKDDWSIDFLYAKVSIEIINRDIKKAKENLKNALKVNSFLPEEIIKTSHKKPKPYRIPGEPHFDAGNPIGSIQQAYEHWERNKLTYKRRDVIEFYKSIQTCT